MLEGSGLCNVRQSESCRGREPVGRLDIESIEDRAVRDEVAASNARWMAAFLTPTKALRQK